MKKIVLIGDGFDLAHHLHTSYFDFQNNVNDPAIDEFHRLVNEMDNEAHFFNEEGNLKEVTWYSFEENIERLTVQKYQENFVNNTKERQYNVLDIEMKKLNDLFDRISYLLYVYLHKEVSNKTIKTLDSIKKVINNETYVINFNYTDTVKLYTDNYNFIHGSINEDETIILGFARNEISDLATSEYIQHNKELLKEKLNFLRYLRTNNYDEDKEITDEFNLHVKCMFSGKGGYDFPLDEEKGEYSTKGISKAICEYATNNKFLPAADNLDYSNVEEIIIMGHGLEADLNEISRIFDKTKNIRNIKLFTFNGESKEQINRKKTTLGKMVNDIPIELVFY